MVKTLQKSIIGRKYQLMHAGFLAGGCPAGKTGWVCQSSTKRGKYPENTAFFG